MHKIKNLLNSDLIFEFLEIILKEPFKRAVRIAYEYYTQYEKFLLTIVWLWCIRLLISKKIILKSVKK